MAKPEEIDEWLRKADEDRLAAEVLLQSDHELAFPILFHLQQLVEKLLKALIIKTDGPFEKTHDLGRLAELAGFSLDSDSMELCELLTVFAVQTRYPGDLPDTSMIAAESNFRKVMELRSVLLARIQKS